MIKGQGFKGKFVPSQKMTTGNGRKLFFRKMPVYDENKKKIKYSVEEGEKYS